MDLIGFMTDPGLVKAGLGALAAGTILRAAYVEWRRSLYDKRVLELFALREKRGNRLRLTPRRVHARLRREYPRATYDLSLGALVRLTNWGLIPREAWSLY